jgi:hypothetical protein
VETALRDQGDLRGDEGPAQRTGAAAPTQCRTAGWVPHEMNAEGYARAARCDRRCRAAAQPLGSLLADLRPRRHRIGICGCSLAPPPSRPVTALPNAVRRLELSVWAPVMRSWVPATLAAATLWLLIGATTAAAHGPCDCITPELGETGVRVRIARTTAFKVIFNPKPAQYGAAMRDTGYASAYQSGAPTATVLSLPRNRRQRNAKFRVPDVPPGVYLVLIFDGSELGQHTTWDYYHVIGPPPATRQAAATPPRAPEGGDDGVKVPVVGLAVATLVLIALVAVTRGVRGRRLITSLRRRAEPR